MKHIITVPNNDEGQKFIKTFRKFLKNTPMGLVTYGRGQRKIHSNGKKWLHNKYRQTLPISLSERISVYISPRPTHRYKYSTKWVKSTMINGQEVVGDRLVNTWERVPTKWGK